MMEQVSIVKRAKFIVRTKRTIPYEKKILKNLSNDAVKKLLETFIFLILKFSPNIHL